MSTASRFSRFLGNLELTSDQVADARTKYDGVASKLHTHYFGSTFTGSSRKLIGSYGKGTAVRPPRDVDVLFLLPSTVYERYKARSGNVVTGRPW
jgi:tRNA nucleotidyltransferase (CCA-adding enzyme)